MCKVPGERDIYMETEDERDLVRHMGKEGAEKKEVHDLSGSDPWPIGRTEYSSERLPLRAEARGLEGDGSGELVWLRQVWAS